MNIRLRMLLIFTFVLARSVYGMDQNNDPRKAVKDHWSRLSSTSENKQKRKREDQIKYVEEKKQKIEPEMPAVNQNNSQPPLLSGSDKVKLKAVDSELNFDVSLDLACESITIKNLVEDNGTENLIPLPNITYNQLKNVIIPALEALAAIKNYYKLVYQRPATVYEIKQDLIIFLKNKKITRDECVEFINNAKYLDIAPVFEVACEFFLEYKDNLEELHNALKKNKIPKKVQEKIAALVPCYCLQKTLETSSFKSLIMTKDTHLIAGLSSPRGFLKIWNRDFNVVNEFKAHDDRCTALAMTNDEKKIIIGTEDKIIKIWDIASGKCEKTLRGHTKRINGLVISADDKYIVSASEDSTVRIWNISNGQCINTLEENSTTKETLVAITPDSKCIITTGESNIIKIWDFESGACINTLVSHLEVIRSLAITPDGKQIISGSKDKTIKIWNISSGQCEKTLSGHNDTVLSVIISSDGKYIISVSLDDMLKIWDFRTGECLQTLFTKSYCDSVMITHDSNDIVAGSKSYDFIKRWSRPTLNQNSKNASPIVQVLLIQKILKHTIAKEVGFREFKTEIFMIQPGSFEEMVWNELPQETREQLQSVVEIK